MKKKRRFFAAVCISATVVLIIAACSLNPVSTVRVKASPTAYLPLNGTKPVFDTKISIPDPKTEGSCRLASATDINDKLLARFNESSQTDLPEKPIPSPIPLSAIPVNLTIQFKGFDELTLEANSKLIITAAPPPGINCSFANAQLRSGTTSYPGIDTGNNEVQFTFTNDSVLKNSLTFTANMTVTGSGSGTIKFNRKLEGAIREAKGVNANLTDISPSGSDTSVKVSLPDDFKKATIGEGTLKLSFKQPEGWSGITIEEKTTIKQAGANGLSINPADFRTLGTEIPLNNQKLNDSKLLTVEPKLNVNLKDATYRKPTTDLSADFSLSITTFKDVTLKNRPDFTISKQEPIPDDMKKWGKKITVKQVTASIRLKNGLPAENPIGIKLSSEAFGIPEKPKTFEAAKETTQKYEVTSIRLGEINDTTQFDFKATVIPPGYDSSTDTFTLKNITIGSDIAFSGSVTFDIKTNLNIDYSIKR